MPILEHHQHRPARGEAAQLIQQRRDGQLPLALRRQVRAADSAFPTGIESSAANSGATAREIVGALAEQRLQLVELALGRIVELERRRALELLDHRMERAVHVVGRAIVAQAGVRRLSQALDQGMREARLADPGSPDSSTTWPFALPRLLEAVEQHAELVLAADERREPGRAARLRTGSPPGCRRPPARPAPCAPKPLSSRPPRSVSWNRPPTRRCVPGPITTLPGSARPLEPGREVRGFADHRLLLRRTLADQIADHHLPRGDADPHRERHRLALSRPTASRLQPGPDGALGVVLVRPRPSRNTRARRRP